MSVFNVRENRGILLTKSDFYSFDLSLAVLRLKPVTELRRHKCMWV